MRYAIISDIHGNLAALEKVLQKISSLECDRVVCLGDVVGYGPYPNECVEIVREQSDIVIMGNHDHAAIGLTDTNDFNQWAREAVAWTAVVLSERSRQFLSQLPFEYKGDDLLFVHATPCKPSRWNYILNLWEAKKNFGCFEEKICFVGHSHIPVSFISNVKNDLSLSTDNPLKIREEFRYIINVGSVGQPRDGDSKAAFVVYDSDVDQAELMRVSYDVSFTQEAMIKFHLPRFLAERLLRGT
jgi:predicted phosphodiesterase